MSCTNSQLLIIHVAVRQTQLGLTFRRFYKDYFRLVRGFRKGLLRFAVVHAPDKVHSNVQVSGEGMAVEIHFLIF